MSRVNDIQELNPDSPLHESLKLLINNGVKELVSLSTDKKGISNPNIIHDIRVSARRLQTVLDSVGEILPLPLLNKGKSTLKDIIKSLGKARENDVSIQLIEKFLKKHKKDSRTDTLKLLIARLRKQAKGHRVDAINNSKVINEINYLSNKYLIQVNTLNIKSFRDIKYLNLNQGIRANGLLIVPRFYDRVMRLAKPIMENPDNENSEELHKMRIKGKPLRYAMEFFRFAYGSSFGKLVKEVKDFVETLGEIHDRDILGEQINEFRIEMSIFNDISPKNKLSLVLLEKLSAKLLLERKKYYEMIRVALQTWNNTNFREKIIYAISE